MKRFLTLLIVAVLFVGAVSAQQRNERPRESNSVTVNGTLKLEKGLIAVESGSSVYFIPRLNRYIGFIDGMREGTAVSVEGFVHRDVIHPTKVTVAGKSYDFIASGPGPGMRNESFGHGRNNLSPHRGNFGPGRNVPNRYNNGPNRRPRAGGCCFG